MRVRTGAVAFVLLGTFAVGGSAGAGVFSPDWLESGAASRYVDPTGEADYAQSSDVGVVQMDGGPSGPITIDVAAGGEPTMRPNSGFVLFLDTDRCKTTGLMAGYDYHLLIEGATPSAAFYRAGSGGVWQPAPAPSLTWFWDNGPKVTIAGSSFGSPASFNFVLATSRITNFGGGDLRYYYDYAPNVATWVYPQDAAPVTPCGVPDSSPSDPATDTVPPNTRLLAAPSARTTGRRATFRFVSTEPGAAFSCKLDRRAWTRCRSGVTYRRLARGTHVFRVRATDRAGNIDRTPATKSWRIT